MKKLLLFLLSVCFTFTLTAQHSPMGMRYQAVVRDSEGLLLSNENMTARIELMTMENNPRVYYEEIHQIFSNEFGILNLTIGEGRAVSGDFENIPWSDQNIWVRTSIRKPGDARYDVVTTSKLYSVPYAQYAKTAGSLVQENYQAITTPLFGWPKVGFNWSLYGNALSKTFNDPPLLGTSDEAPVVFITNNTERMRITEEGNINVLDDLNIDADLAITDDLSVNGKATIADSLTVNGPVDFTGNLIVGGETILEDSLTVHGPLSLNDNLLIQGKAKVEDSLIVNGPVIFDVEVEGLQTTQSSYPVLIKGSKQGLAIDLVPATEECLISHRGNNYISFWRDGIQKGRIEGMGRGDLDPTGLMGMFIDILQDPSAFGNGLGDAFNINLADPMLSFSSQLAGIIDFNTGSFPEISGGTLPSLDPGSFPPTSIDDFPQLDPGEFPSLSGGMLPGISFNTPAFTNPFENTVLLEPFESLFNKFNAAEEGGDPACIAGLVSPARLAWDVLKTSLMTSGLYPDQEDATDFESQIFSNYTLDVLQSGISTLTSAVTFFTSLGSILDPEDIFSQGLDLMTNIYSLVIYGSYTDINLGVAYESGAGDYAEWLLRADSDEIIQPGDIVGVIGGRISKKFVHADRFMAVSTSPLLLGNMPQTREEEQLHEKVAFVGQIPVKVRGEVRIGDYILPSGSGDGVAIAVNPAKMLAKDYQRIIGVAWEESLQDGFMQLVNTAVGINHNDMAKTIEQMQFTLNHIQDQLKKMDPEYVSHDYEVTIDHFGSMSPGYSVSDYHPSRVASYFQDQSFESRADILADVREKMVNFMGIDLSKVPIIDFALSHPDRAGFMASDYQSILDDMIRVRGELNSRMEK